MISHNNRSQTNNAKQPFLLLLLLAVVVGTAPASWATGVIDTIVGGANGDGLPAAVAKIAPEGMDRDSSGNFYIADSGGNRIRRIDASTNIITTIAGNGTAGFSGDNGPATAAMLNSPSGLVVDTAGNVYFSDETNHRVRRIDGHSGIITTFAGNGSTTFNSDGIPATSASLYYPEGLALLPDGSLLIADSQHFRIRKVSTNGIITTVAGAGNSFVPLGDNGPATSALLSNPVDVGTDTQGNFYIADAGICRIRRVDAVTQIITTVAGGAGGGATICSDAGDNGPAINADINGPSRIAVTTRHIYIAEQSKRVRDLDLTTGMITTNAGTGSTGSSGDGGLATHATFTDISGVWADDLGNIRIADAGARNVRLVNATGIIDTIVGGANGDGLPAEEAVLAPQGMDWDAHGNLYIVDTTGNCIRRIDAVTNIITTIAGTGAAGFGGDNGPAIAATLNNPTAIAVDSAGNLYVSDERNHRVRRVDGRSGVITTFAGNGSSTYNGDGIAATAASLYYPEGLALVPDGSLLIADSDHLRVRKVSPSGIISTVAGTGNSFGPANLGDGGPATSAVLVYPVDVTVDSAGNFYITDATTCIVWRVDATTRIISRIAGGAGSGSSICAYRGDGGPALLASLNNPQSAVVDSNGIVYIAEPQAPRVRAVDPTTGVITTAAGTGVSSYSGDGGDPTRATFVHLGGLLLDTSNSLYIADRDGGNVRRILWSGTLASPTPTRTPSPLPTSTAVLPTATRTPTSTPTSTPPRTPTPIVGVSGRVLYYSNGAAVSNATLQLTAPLLGTVAQTQSDTSGQYSLSGLNVGSFSLRAQKTGDLSAGISALDAVYVLEALSGTRTLSSAQMLACDVTGNGSLSSLDASVILQYKSGLIPTLPVAQTCASDWAFVPAPQSAPIQTIAPLMRPGSCQAGAVTFNPLAGLTAGIDFSAVLFGDCTGNWQPGAGAGAALSAFGMYTPKTASAGHLGRVRRHGRRISVPLYVQADGGFQSLDAQFTYDPTVLSAVRVRLSGTTQGALMAANTTIPGQVVIALASATRLPAGQVLSLEFNSANARLTSNSIQIAHVAAN